MMFDGKEGKLTCTLFMHLTLYLCVFRSPWLRRIGPWWISRSSINCYCWVLFFLLQLPVLTTRLQRAWDKAYYPFEFFNTNYNESLLTIFRHLEIKQIFEYSGGISIYNERAKFYLQYKILKCFPNKTSSFQTFFNSTWSVAVYSLSADCIFWRIHRSPDALNVNSKSNILLIWRNQVERIAPHTRHVHNT